MKKLFIVAVILAMVSCGGPKSTKTTTETGADASATQDVPTTKWEYAEEVNEMDDSKTSTATIEANEELEFQFPYSGGTKVWLVVRKGSDGTNIMLAIPKKKGQFLPGTMGDKYITARFDENPAEKYYYSSPSDYSSTTIFVKNADKFLTNLKTAKHTLVQCEFFNEGTRTIKFDTDGFVWEK